MAIGVVGGSSIACASVVGVDEPELVDDLGNSPAPSSSGTSVTPPAGEACNATKPCAAPQTCCNGVCASTLTDTKSCGTCGNACSTLNVAAGECQSGTCVFDCQPGFAHCKNTNTGCETDIASTLNTCGSCTNDCATKLKNVTGATCAAGKCDYTACAGNFVDANTDRSDGCETPCGQRGQACCTGRRCISSSDNCSSSSGKCVES